MRGKKALSNNGSDSFPVFLLLSGTNNRLTNT